MYDKNFLKCDVTCSLPPSLCHKMSHFLAPLPLEREVLYGRPPIHDNFRPYQTRSRYPGATPLFEAAGLEYAVDISGDGRRNFSGGEKYFRGSDLKLMAWELATMLKTQNRTAESVNILICFKFFEVIFIFS